MKFWRPLLLIATSLMSALTGFFLFESLQFYSPELTVLYALGGGCSFLVAYHMCGELIRIQ